MSNSIQIHIQIQIQIQIQILIQIAISNAVEQGAWRYWPNAHLSGNSHLPGESNFGSEGGSLVVYHQLSCQNWSFHGINDPFKGRHCRHGGLSRSDNCRQWEIRWTTSWALSPLQPSRQSGNALIVKPLWTFNFRASATILVFWHPGTKPTSE